MATPDNQDLVCDEHDVPIRKCGCIVVWFAMSREKMKDELKHMKALEGTIDFIFKNSEDVHAFNRVMEWAYSKYKDMEPA